MAVSATTLRVQEFDKGRGPVGLPPIGQACDLPAWPDQDRRPYRRIGYCQTREIATGLGLAVGALAGMFMMHCRNPPVFHFPSDQGSRASGQVLAELEAADGSGLGT